MKTPLEKNRLISARDLELVTVTDRVDEAVELMLDYRPRVGPPASVPQALA